MTLGERIRLVRSVRQHARQRAERAVPRLCSGCGIDLPTAWHWDGCEVAAEVARMRRVHA